MMRASVAAAVGLTLVLLSPIVGFVPSRAANVNLAGLEHVVRAARVVTTDPDSETEALFNEPGPDLLPADLRDHSATVRRRYGPHG